MNLQDPYNMGNSLTNWKTTVPFEGVQVLEVILVSWQRRNIENGNGFRSFIGTSFLSFLGEFAKQLRKEAVSFVIPVCPFVSPSIAMSLCTKQQSPTWHIFVKFYKHIADCLLKLDNTLQFWLELDRNSDTLKENRRAVILPPCGSRPKHNT
jgi:hypothetical protein